MGYPMTWDRVIHRNGLCGNYTRLRVGNAVWPTDDTNRNLLMICGDIRRLEQDSVDGQYATQLIAERAGVDKETVVRVLRSFFNGAPELQPHDEVTPSTNPTPAGDGAREE